MSSARDSQNILIGSFSQLFLTRLGLSSFHCKEFFFQEIGRTIITRGLILSPCAQVRNGWGQSKLAFFIIIIIIISRNLVHDLILLKISPDAVSGDVSRLMLPYCRAATTSEPCLTLIQQPGALKLHAVSRKCVHSAPNSRGHL